MADLNEDKRVNQLIEEIRERLVEIGQIGETPGFLTDFLIVAAWSDLQGEEFVALLSGEMYVPRWKVRGLLAAGREELDSEAGYICPTFLEGDEDDQSV